MPRPTTIAALLAGFPPPVRALAEAARARVLDLVPTAEERLRAGWGLIGYAAPAYFAFVLPRPDDVRIGFEWGVLLDDPERLLEGDGSQVRHVTVRSPDDLRRPALAALILAAAELRAPPRRR